VRCESSGVLVPKDKAIKRFIVRNIVDASAIRDIQDASVLEGQLFKPFFLIGSRVCGRYAAADVHASHKFYLEHKAHIYTADTFPHY